MQAIFGIGGPNCPPVRVNVNTEILRQKTTQTQKPFKKKKSKNKWKLSWSLSFKLSNDDISKTESELFEFCYAGPPVKHWVVELIGFKSLQNKETMQVKSMLMNIL